MIKLVHHEMVINSKFLEVPRSYYQRHLNANRVKRIAAEFDERIANAPKVSYRNGHYYVFDGQHTIAARKLLKKRHVDLRMSQPYIAVTSEQIDDLLGEVAVGSFDYNAVKPLVDGEVSRFMGFVFVPYEDNGASVEGKGIPTTTVATHTATPVGSSATGRRHARASAQPSAVPARNGHAVCATPATVSPSA